jgi:hypothetical protein
MSRASKLAIEARIEELVPLLLDGLRSREIRAYVSAKTSWGPLVSEAQLKRYLGKARRKIAAAASIDRSKEIGAAKLRYEHSGMLDIEAARRTLEEELAEEIADGTEL